MSDSRLPNLLVTMRVSLHVMFAALLTIAVVTSWPVSAVEGLLAVALAVTYVVGTTAQHRGKALSTTITWCWLALILVLWTALVMASAQFIWLLFPLVFLMCHLTPTPWSLLVVTGAWAVAVGVPLATGALPLSVGGLLGPAIGTVAALGTYYFYRALRKEAAHLAVLNAELRTTRDELACQSQLAGQLAERERLTREIHDTTAQSINSIVLLSRACRHALGSGDVESLRRQVEAIHEQASQSLVEVRELIDGTTPTTDVAHTLRTMVDSQSQRSESLGLSTSIVLHVDAPAQLDPALAATIVRVAQEAVTNALKHSNAQHIVVTLAAWDDAVHLDVVDDGCGFDPQAATGFGLAAMRRRVEESRGVLNVESSADGTTVAAEFVVKDN